MRDYDSIPYESLPIPETAPWRLETLGRLFGLQPAPVDECRVLEFGCASGGNIIPMAWQCPDAEFVGLELAENQVQDGARQIGKLGLRNIQLQQADILTLDPASLGKFDYIIAHGVYSWVPADVRLRMLDLYKQLLKPQGIGFISYNTQPGWRARGAMREMLQYHVREIQSPAARLQAVQQFLTVMEQVYSKNPSPLAQYYVEECRVLRRAHPSYVYHEYLEADNNAFLFTEVMGELERGGLRYLCETNLNTMFGSALGTEAEAFLDSCAGAHAQEQYMDFLRLRPFRQTLVCHAELSPNYEITLEGLDQFAVYSQLLGPEKLPHASIKPQQFMTAEGKPFTVSHPATKLALIELRQRYPAAVAFPELWQCVQSKLTDARFLTSEAQSEWRNEMFGLFLSDGIRFVTAARRPAITDGTGKLLATALARMQSEQGEHLSTCWHDILQLDTFGRRLLLHLDGTKTRGELLDALLQDIERGDLALPGHHGNKGKQRVELQNNVERLLHIFRVQGILQETNDK